MTVGLYFGSFNPIHTGHLIIAQHMLSHHGLDEVWFVVTPHNPMKAADGLAPEQDRLEMVRRAVADNPRLVAEDVEFGLPRPNYTAHTMDSWPSATRTSTSASSLGKTTCGPYSNGHAGGNSWTAMASSSTPGRMPKARRGTWKER